MLLRRLDLACEVQNRVKEATNCSLLYHHRVVLPTYFDNYFQNFENVHHIHVSIFDGLFCGKLFHCNVRSIFNSKLEIESHSTAIKIIITSKLL